MAEKKDKNGKKTRTGRKHSKVELHKLYSPDGERKRKNCPRCGPGTFLAENPNRQYCGRCGYTEFQK